MKEIELTQGKVALVDDADYDWLNQWKWYAAYNRGSKFSAQRTIGSSANGNKGCVHMHRLIAGIIDRSMQVDHIDGNPLNNQRINLRVCTNNENQYNKPPRPNRSSKYKGVWFDKARGKWACAITHNKQRTPIGRFVSETAAALAYNEAAKRHHGEFAWLNSVTD